MDNFKINEGWVNHKSSFYIVRHVDGGLEYLIKDGRVVENRGDFSSFYENNQDEFWWKNREEAQLVIDSYNKRENPMIKFKIITEVRHNDDGESFPISYIKSVGGYQYLHNNGTVHGVAIKNMNCSVGNNLTDYLPLGGYFETRKAAQKVLDQYIKDNTPKLTVEERLERLETKVGL